MDNISWISGEQEKMKLKLFDVWKPKTKLVDPPPPSPKRKLDEIEENLFYPVLICQKIKQEIPETCDKSKPFNEQEKVEASEIFVKSEKDIKPEIIFGISDSDSKYGASTLSYDPLQISACEGKEVSQQQISYSMDIYNPVAAPLSAVRPGAPEGVQGQQAPTISTFQAQNPQEQKFEVKFLGQNTVTFKGKQIIVNKIAHAPTTTLHAIKCQFCPKKFSKGAGMSKHVTSVHAVKCQFCPAKFLKFKDMRNHIKKAHEANNQSTYPDSNSKKRRKCPICYKDKFYCLC